MDNKPKVSILIPVYNVENYIEQCMDSAVNQTFENIEIICVNDCSTDSSLKIIQKYAKNDSRIVIVDKKQNEGLLLARKSGVEAATGEYIIFVDSDDYIDLNLCQFINDITSKEDADIIHFTSGVDTDAPNSNFEALVKTLKPLEKTLIGDEILDNAYIKKTYATQVWAKIYKTDLCKKTYSVLPDEHCYVGEDVFTTFFLSYFAKKYIGVKTPSYYFYRFGLGVSGQSKISLKKFEMFAKMSNWIKYTQEFLDKENANELCSEACEAMKNRLFADCCEIYRRRVRNEDKGAAEELIYRYWKDTSLKDEDWVKHTGKTKDYIANQTEVNEYTKTAEAFKEENPKVSVISYVYNNAETLDAFIEKITSHTLQQTEYIFVNDGSDDNSLDIIEKYAENDNRITVINQKHKGASYAVNKAADSAKGKYIYFADLNNETDKTIIEKAYNKAETEALDILFLSFYRSDEIISGEKMLSYLVNNNENVSDLNTKLFNREYIQKNIFIFNNNIEKAYLINIPLLIAEAERVSCSDYNIQSKSCSSYNFTTEEFLNYYIAYADLTAKNIVSPYSETTKKAISNICKNYYNICRDIYVNLSSGQKKKIKEILPAEYKPMFFNIKELIDIKSSSSYRLINKLLSIPSKILKK